MKKFIILFLLSTMGILTAWSQNKLLKLEVYYFHPTERCPIDQSIEANTTTVVQTYFAKQIKDGTILCKVLNTEDKANTKIVSKFNINAQALYIVKLDKGKEIQKDLTRFAFDYGKSNPGKFKADLKGEIEKALQ